jgi:hypothetical protein
MTTTDSKERDLMALVDAYAEARHIGGCHTYNAKTAEARANVVAALRAQQPAPAGEESKPHGWLYDWTHSSATGKPDTTYTGFTKDEAHARKHDNCTAVFTTPQPSPTPQADSQPAPVVDGYPALPSADLHAIDTAPEWWGTHQYERVSDDHSDDPDVIDFYTADQLRAYVDADRAARAPADSVTAPAATVIKKGADRQWMSERLGHLPDGIYSLYLAPPTQAADSVLEDAARLERERICATIKAEDDYCVDNGDYMLDSDDCIKIVRGEWVRPDFSVTAARKQGGAT